MFRVTLRSHVHGTKTTVLSPSPYADETREWLQLEAIGEAMDRNYGPARKKLARIRRELCGSGTDSRTQLQAP